MYTKYSKAQLNAISRNYAKKNEEARQKELDARGLRLVFEYGSYKKLHAFLNAKPEKIEREKQIAIENCRAKIESAIAHRWSPESVETIKSHLAELERIANNTEV